jgi:hypothetical protein
MIQGLTPYLRVQRAAEVLRCGYLVLCHFLSTGVNDL